MSRTLDRTYNLAVGRLNSGEDESDAGFTLIEAVVAFAIFAIVIAAAVLAIVAGISTSNTNRDRVTAANVAQQALAKVQTLSLASLTAAGSVTSVSTVGAEQYTVTRSIDYSKATGSPGSLTTTTATSCPAAITSGTAYWVHVAVVVTWPGSKGRNVQLDTVRSC